MRGGVLLIIFAIILAYLGVSGKYKCFTVFAACLLGNDAGCNCGDSATPTPSNYDATDKTQSPNIAIRLPQLPRLPTTPIIYG